MPAAQARGRRNCPVHEVEAVFYRPLEHPFEGKTGGDGSRQGASGAVHRSRLETRPAEVADT